MMRKSLELATSCAYLFGVGSWPTFSYVDDIHFLRPVSSGDFIRFTANVTFTYKSAMNVFVIVESLSNENNTLVAKSVFKFNAIFVANQELKQIVPIDWEDMMMYVEGKRRIESKFDTIIDY